jgi:hypothetical protein
MIHGPPNTGKTTIGLLLAEALNACYCNTFKPWTPNDYIASLYSRAEPSEEKPLIIALDEFDTALEKIHHGLVPENPKVPTPVRDKSGWNTFFDDIQRGMYPYLIILLTSNKIPQHINEMDPCYIRLGRVDLIEEM